MTIWTVCVPLAARVGWSLLNVQVAANGRPRQPRDMTSVKPLTDASVRLTVVCCLLWSWIVPWLIFMVNWVADPAEPEVMVSVPAVVTEVPALGS